MSNEPEDDFYQPSVVTWAEEVLTMHRELLRLREECHYLRGVQKKYLELLDSDIQHEAHMVGSLLKLAMTPGVLEACKANTKGDQ